MVETATDSPTGLRLLPLPGGAELHDLAIGVDGNDGVGIDGTAELQVALEAGRGERAAVLRVGEQPPDVVAVAAVEQRAGLRGVVQLDVGKAPSDAAHVAAGARRVFERKVAVAPGADDGDVGAGAGRRPEK